MPAILSASTEHSFHGSPSRKNLNGSPSSAKSTQAKMNGLRNGHSGKHTGRLSSETVRYGKKRTAVYFDEDIEMEHPPTVGGTTSAHGKKRRKWEMNGVVNGQGHSHNTTKAKLIQEQRAQLPITQGAFFCSALFSCLSQLRRRKGCHSA